MPKSRIKIPLDSDKILSNIMGSQNTPMMMKNQTQRKSIAEMLKNLPMKDQKRKRTTAATTRTQTTAVNQSDENETGKKKENLIMIILKYQQSKRFGPILKKDLKLNYTRDTLSRKKINQIEVILHRIRSFLNSRNLDAVFEHMASTCAIGYEKTVTPFYNIDGFSQILLQNPDFWDCLERWKIERELPNIPPHLQMLYIVASTTITAHEINKLKSPAVATQPDLVIVDKDDKKEKETELEKEKTVFQVGKSL